MLEFQTYLAEGTFKRHHFASLKSQLFDPSFCLNGIFFNIANLINREVIASYKGTGTMPWLTKIDPKHYNNITKIVQLYFRSQSLTITRYLLCKNLSIDKMHNMVIAFSDGSRQFSTSVVYLVSYNPNGPEYSINMVSSLSRLGRMSKKEGEAMDSNTVPKRECHGLFLATCGVSNLCNLLHKIKLPLTKVYIFSDAIAHIIALKSSPSLFPMPFNRLYAEINALTYQIGELTSQPK